MNHRARKTLRHVVSVASFATGLLVPVLANAQQPNPNCPPGSWFCADTGTQPSAPPNQPVPQAPPPSGGAPLEPLPPPAAPAPPAPPPAARPLPPPPPVVVYQPPPPVMIVRPEAPPPPPYYYSPRERIRREWGLRFQLEGLSIGRGSGNRDASMGGLGFGLRYKPVPAFGIEADLDFVGGTDYNGMKRNETAFTINGLIFLNPRSKAQLYLLGGFGWSGARVIDDTSPTASSAQMNYAYFGAQAGFGLELRLGRHFALNGDIRGFIRGRIDDQAQYTAEFRNAQGQTSNTSGGGVLTLGATLYF
jgi:hypothetical protein